MAKKSPAKKKARTRKKPEPKVIPIDKLKEKAMDGDTEALKRSLEVLATTPPKEAPKALQKASKELGVPEKDIEPVVAEIQSTATTTLEIERRTYGVDSATRERFEELYQVEIDRMKTCPYEVKRKTKTGRYSNRKERCGAPLIDVLQMLVHHQLHLMFDADTRTQRAVNVDVRETVAPMSEKTERAALGPEERRRMLKDGYLQKRLAARRES